MDEARLREAAHRAREHAQHGRPNGVDDEMRKLVQQAVRECEEIAQRNDGFVPHCGQAIRERFKWLGGGD